MEQTHRSLGVAISGGGHRATIFSLGSLLYLCDTGLNKSVKSVSSVSGGSITNAILSILPHHFDGKSFAELDPDDFETAATRIAKVISGSPAWWCVSISWLATSILLSLGMTYSYFAGVGPWQIHLLLMLSISSVSAVIGPKSGGTFFGQPFTWVWMSITFYALFLGAVLLGIGCYRWACDIQTQSVLFPIVVGPILLALSFLSLGQRSHVSAFAMQKYIEHLFTRNRKSFTLTDTAEFPSHVFCSTDLQTGRHVYLSRDWICSDAIGIGHPKTISLGTVVQASANLPIAFPPLTIPEKSLWFSLPNAHRYRGLVLVDGGVRDNTGANWFLESRNRKQIFQGAAKAKSLSGIDSSNNIDRAAIDRAIDGCSPNPDDLIVINSSSAYFSEPKPSSKLTLAMLLKVPLMQYNNEGARQMRYLSQSFWPRLGSSAHRRAAIVSIGDPQSILVRYLSQNKIWPNIQSRAYQRHVRFWREIRAKFEIPDASVRDLQIELNKAFDEAVDANEQAVNAQSSWFNSYFPNYPDIGEVSPSIQRRASEVLCFLQTGVRNYLDLLEATEKDSEDQARRIAREIDSLLNKLAILKGETAKQRGEGGYKRESAETLVSDARRESTMAEIEYAIAEKETRLDEIENASNPARLLNFGSNSLNQWAIDIAKEVEFVEKNKTVRTTFRPLGFLQTSRLLYQGYYAAMINCAIFLEGPLPKSLPDIKDFEELAIGNRRPND